MGSNPDADEKSESPNQQPVFFTRLCFDVPRRNLPYLLPRKHQLRVKLAKDEAEMLSMKNKELNNGRLSMIVIAGICAQEVISGTELLGSA